MMQGIHLTNVFFSHANVDTLEKICALSAETKGEISNNIKLELVQHTDRKSDVDGMGCCIIEGCIALKDHHSEMSRKLGVIRDQLLILRDSPREIRRFESQLAAAHNFKEAAMKIALDLDTLLDELSKQETAAE